MPRIILDREERIPALDDRPDQWDDDETPPDSLGAPCTECGRPTLSHLRPLCACCEADAEGRE